MKYGDGCDFLARIGYTFGRYLNRDQPRPLIGQRGTMAASGKELDGNDVFPLLSSDFDGFVANSCAQPIQGCDHL